MTIKEAYKRLFDAAKSEPGINDAKLVIGGDLISRNNQILTIYRWAEHAEALEGDSEYNMGYIAAARDLLELLMAVENGEHRKSEANDE